MRNNTPPTSPHNRDDEYIEDEEVEEIIELPDDENSDGNEEDCKF
jgi:hypothetical protein